MCAVVLCSSLRPKLNSTKGGHVRVNSACGKTSSALRSVAHTRCPTLGQAAGLAFPASGHTHSPFTPVFVDDISEQIA